MTHVACQPGLDEKCSFSASTYFYFKIELSQEGRNLFFVFDFSVSRLEKGSLVLGLHLQCVQQHLKDPLRLQI